MEKVGLEGRMPKETRYVLLCTLIYICQALDHLAGPSPIVSTSWAELDSFDSNEACHAVAAGFFLDGSLSRIAPPPLRERGAPLPLLTLTRAPFGDLLFRLLWLRTAPSIGQPSAIIVTEFDT